MFEFDWKKMLLFAGGALFGTAGVRILTSKDAKKLYTNCTAAVLRGKDCVMKTATDLQENAEDILAEAKQINADREAAECCDCDAGEACGEEAPVTEENE